MIAISRKTDPVACPVEACPRRFAHLGERIGSRDELHRPVGRDRVSRGEQVALEVGERGRRLGRVEPAALGAEARRARWSAPRWPIGVGRDRREEERHRDALGESREQPSRVRAEPPDAVDEQLGAVERRGVGDGERVLAVVAVGPASRLASVEVDERCRLRLGLGGVGRERCERLESIASCRSSRTSRRVASAKPGVCATGPKYPSVARAISAA